jgi:hypothetical protein
VWPDTKNSGPAAIGSTLPGSGVIFAGYTLFFPTTILFPAKFLDNLRREIRRPWAAQHPGRDACKDLLIRNARWVFHLVPGPALFR